MARNDRVEEPLQQKSVSIESKLPGRGEEEKQAREVDTAGKTENFLTRNVKLITFLICIAIIFSPFVLTYIEDTIEANREDSRPEMTVDNLVAIAKRGKDLRLRDLANFEGYRTDSEMQGMKYAMYRIPVLHEDNIVLSISFDASLDYVFHLKLINQDTKEELDLLVEADKLEEFLTVPAN